MPNFDTMCALRDISDITKRLVAARKNKGLSIKAVSDAAGVTYEAVRQWELGGNVTALNLACWAAALGYKIKMEDIE